MILSWSTKGENEEWWWWFEGIVKEDEDEINVDTLHFSLDFMISCLSQITRILLTINWQEEREREKKSILIGRR